MSIAGNTPHYILAQKRDNGLIDYAVFNPRGYGSAELIHVAPCAAKDEEQMLSRADYRLLSSQAGADITYINNLQLIIERHKSQGLS